jgi:hypothetical protein
MDAAAAGRRSFAKASYTVCQEARRVTSRQGTCGVLEHAAAVGMETEVDVRVMSKGERGGEGGTNLSKRTLSDQGRLRGSLGPQGDEMSVNPVSELHAINKAPWSEHGGCRQSPKRLAEPSEPAAWHLDNRGLMLPTQTKTTSRRSLDGSRNYSSRYTFHSSGRLRALDPARVRLVCICNYITLGDYAPHPPRVAERGAGW